MTLRDESLDFINEHKETLAKLAQFRYLPIVKASVRTYGEDAWFGINRKLSLGTESDPMICDLNIWKDDDTGVWRGSVYPVEIKEHKGRKVEQTDAGTWVNLF